MNAPLLALVFICGLIAGCVGAAGGFAAGWHEGASQPKAARVVPMSEIAIYAFRGTHWTIEGWTP